MIRNNSPLRTMIVLFVILNALFVTGRSVLARWGIDQSVIIAGNLIVFAVSLVSFALTRKSLGNANPNAFVRAIYLSFIIKFFVCAVAAFAYIMSAKKNVNKPALIASMVLYIVYAVIEVSSLTKLLKPRKNA
jgi:hypothetical protein